MGRMQRRKGAAGEREAAEKLNEVLGTHLRRGRQYCGGPESPDVAGDLPGLHLEVKRVEALRLYPSLEQARRDAGTGDVPAVMHRMNKKPWVMIVYADDLIRLLDVVDACRARVAETGDWSPEAGGLPGAADGGQTAEDGKSNAQG
jgi:Holliday junction resolvase